MRYPISSPRCISDLSPVGPSVPLREEGCLRWYLHTLILGWSLLGEDQVRGSHGVGQSSSQAHYRVMAAVKLVRSTCLPDGVFRILLCDTLQSSDWYLCGLDLASRGRLKSPDGTHKLHSGTVYQASSSFLRRDCRAVQARITRCQLFRWRFRTAYIPGLLCGAGTYRWLAKMQKKIPEV